MQLYKTGEQHRRTRSRDGDVYWTTSKEQKGTHVRENKNEFNNKTIFFNKLLILANIFSVSLLSPLSIRGKV